jgi:hypothetical protein
MGKRGRAADQKAPEPRLIFPFNEAFASRHEKAR